MRRSSSFLFGAELLAWAVWLGGLMSLAVAAPLIFQIVPSRDLAGRVFGAILERTFPIVYACSAAQLVTSLARPTGRLGLVKGALSAGVLAISLYAGLVVMGEMQTIQASLPGPIDTLPLDTGPRARFDVLHKLSERLVGFDVLIGLVLLPLMVATRPAATARRAAAEPAALGRAALAPR